MQGAVNMGGLPQIIFKEGAVSRLQLQVDLRWCVLVMAFTCEPGMTNSRFTRSGNSGLVGTFRIHLSNTSAGSL